MERADEVREKIELTIVHIDTSLNSLLTKRQQKEKKLQAKKKKSRSLGGIRTHFDAKRRQRSVKS